MNRRNLFWVCIFLFALSCGGENNASQKKVDLEKDNDDVTTIDSREPSISENLLTEINNSSEELNASSNIIDTLFLSIHSSVQDGFALMCKFEAENKTKLKTYVFDRNSEGELIQKNAFVGILLGKDTATIDYPKIMLRFVELDNKEDLYSYNCWFGFDRNISKYVFEHCVSITKTYKGRKKSLDVYYSEVESIEDQILTNKEVLSVLEMNNYLN